MYKLKESVQGKRTARTKDSGALKRTPKATWYGVLEDGADNPFGEMNEHAGIPDGPIALQMLSGEIIRSLLLNTLQITRKPRKKYHHCVEGSGLHRRGDTDVDAGILVITSIDKCYVLEYKTFIYVCVCVCVLGGVSVWGKEWV